MIGKSVELSACVFMSFILGVVAVEVEDGILVESEDRLDLVSEVEVAMTNNVNSVEEQSIVSRDLEHERMVIITLIQCYPSIYFTFFYYVFSHHTVHH